MVNGKWLMRQHALLTLNETDLLQQAASYAKRIDVFLMAREQSVLSKLIDWAVPSRRKASKCR